MQSLELTAAKEITSLSVAKNAQLACVRVEKRLLQARAEQAELADWIGERSRAGDNVNNATPMPRKRATRKD